MEAYFHLIWLVITVISALLAAFKIDPDRKYRSVVIKVLTQVKQVTPDNIDDVIDRINSALEGEGLDVNKKAVSRIVLEVREDVSGNTEVAEEASPGESPSSSEHTHNPKTHEH